MFDTSKKSYKKAIAYYRHSAEDKQENSVAIQRVEKTVKMTTIFRFKMTTIFGAK